MASFNGSFAIAKDGVFPPKSWGNPEFDGWIYEQLQWDIKVMQLVASGENRKVGVIQYYPAEKT